MKTYRVTTYDEAASYTVSLDDNGVVDVDGVLPATAEIIKETVARHIERRGLRPAVALGLAVGSYSNLTEIAPVADSL